MFILKNLNIEAKRTGSIVILYLKKRKKTNFRFFLNEEQKTKGFDSKLSKFCHCYSAGFSTVQYSTAAHGLGLVVKYHLPWRRASKSVSDMPSCERYTA
jgi:hypothetical protein